MSGEGLVELARKYVALSDQLEAVRGQIARAVANGAAGEAARPTQPARSSGGSQHPNALKAAEVEARILELLKARPMRMAEIAVETEAKQSTTSERLKRMRERGLVALADGAWAITA